MSSLHVARIAACLFNTPLLLTPDTAVAIATNLAARFDVEPMDAALDDTGVIEASRFRGAPAGLQKDGRSLYRAAESVAIIPVQGELVNRGGWIGASSGLTAYEGLDAQLRAADADAAVTGILLDLNSPGGEASGCMEIGALVRDISTRKPVVAFVNGAACSAAYAIAAGARTIIATPSATLGSIGVVWLHVDRSGALAKAGLKPTLLHAGAHKIDGTGVMALPDEARDRIQASIDGVYGLFVDHVARLRGLDAATVRAMEAGLFLGAQAVAAGLADRLGTFDDALACLKHKPSTLKTGAFSMETITRAEHEAALRAQAETHTAALAAAVTTTTGAERQRIGAILGHAEAEGREALARHFAFSTSMTVEDAATALAAGAKAAAPATAQGPRTPRLGVVDPKLTPDAPEPDGQTGIDASWDAVGKSLR